MTGEPYDRQDAADLFTRLKEAESARLVLLAVAKAIVQRDESTPQESYPQVLLTHAETNLAELLRVYSKLPDQSVPFPEVERRARGLFDAFRQNVEYWLDLRS